MRFLVNSYFKEGIEQKITNSIKEAEACAIKNINIGATKVIIFDKKQLKTIKKFTI